MQSVRDDSEETEDEDEGDDDQEDSGNQGEIEPTDAIPLFPDSDYIGDDDDAPAEGEQEEEGDGPDPSEEAELPFPFTNDPLEMIHSLGYPLHCTVSFPSFD